MTLIGSASRSYAPSGWDLSQLFAGTDDPQLGEALRSVELCVSDLESRRDSLEGSD